MTRRITGPKTDERRWAVRNPDGTDERRSWYKDKAKELADELNRLNRDAGYKVFDRRKEAANEQRPEQGP